MFSQIISNASRPSTFLLRRSSKPLKLPSTSKRSYRTTNYLLGAEGAELVGTENRSGKHVIGRALRETGVAAKIAAGEEVFSIRRPVMSLLGSKPYVANDAFVSPTSTVCGSVYLVDSSSVWYNSVVKGDCNEVRVGCYTAILDRAVVNTVQTLDTGFPASCHIGNWTVIGSNSVVTSSSIGDYCNIGEGCVVPEGCIIEDGVTLMPGTVLEPGSLCGKDSIWEGNPARSSSSPPPSRSHNKSLASQIQLIAQDHIEEYLPYGDAHKHLEEVVVEGDGIEEGGK
mmetsp:Transcript_14622/g.30000  ORF Transcript_14622/g.30000 Transcript_14622/m.30000 type:complete len:284 (+) Transcript_14622:117-968(+)